MKTGRYKANPEAKRCGSCGETKPAAEFAMVHRHRDPTAPKRLYAHCKPCQYAKNRDYWKRTRKDRTATAKKWSQANKEKMCSYQKAYRLRNLERSRALKVASKKRTEEKVRRQMFDAYGHRCSCCGESRKTFLTLEHTRRDGAEHRREVGSTSSVLYDLRRRGWPKDGYTVLCMNCNWGSYRAGGTCPHVAERIPPCMAA